MKLKKKGSAKPTLSDRIADALTVKPRADIEDDQVFGTKPQTVSRVDLGALGSSDSEDEAAISDFRKRNVNLLSEVSKKYAGQVVSRKELEQDSEASKTSSDDDVSDDEPNGGVNGSYADDLLSKIKKSIEANSDSDNDIKLPTINRDNSSYAEDLLSKIKKSIEANSDSDNDIKLAPKNKTDTDSEDDSDGDESDDYGITTSHKRNDKNDDESNDDESNDDESNDDDEEGGIDISEMEHPMKESFEHVKKQNISEEAKKGASVRNQLLVWEGLLEMRIHLQRCMNTANQMPLVDTFEDLKKENEFLEESNATKANVANVLDKLLNLQSILFKNYPETKSLSNKKVEKDKPKQEESDEEIPSDTDNEEIPSDTEPESDHEEKTKPQKAKEVSIKKRKLEEYESELSTTHKAFKSFRDTSIQKWNEKTRVATANIKSAPTNSVLQQISYILSDRDKLVRRTQLKRSEFDIIGYTKPQENDDEEVTKSRKDDDEYIPEIFDDSDFYHQLLRELIECKSADISDPVQLSRQWIALQQMRSKMKRKVDTKATKGRKIKYVVHNQLVNYMGPEQSLSWNDESRNELYSSLFGKMFEQDGANGNARNFYKL